MNSAIEIIDLEQNTPKWFKFRQNGIGASETAAILERNKKCTPYQLWQKKLGIKPPDEETEAMRRGKELEPVARAEFIKKTGIEMIPTVIKNHSFPSFMFASLDGLSPCGKYALEIKIPWTEEGHTHTQAMLYDEIPEYYIPQLNKQAMLANVEFVFYYSWNENSSKIIEFHRDSNLEKEIIEKETEFWDCVQNFKEPKLTERDYIQRNDAEWMEATNQWKSVKDKLKQLEEQEEAARKWLLEISQNQCCQGNGVKLTKFVRRGNIEYNKVPELIGRNLEPYRKPPIVSWRVS